MPTYLWPSLSVLPAWVGLSFAEAPNVSLSASYLGTAPVLKWWVLLSHTLSDPASALSSLSDSHSNLICTPGA